MHSGLLGSFSATRNLDAKNTATGPVYLKTAVLLGVSFSLLMIINPPNRDI